MTSTMNSETYTSQGTATVPIQHYATPPQAIRVASAGSGTSRKTKIIIAVVILTILWFIAVWANIKRLSHR